MKIALIGNQNSGKTSIFNELTGSMQYVGNWPGVTVEKKEGKLKNHENATLVDLPGIYSLSPYTSEEVVTRDFLINDKPDAIINIIDATNIERNLNLTLQLSELDIPIVIALNMMDIVKKRGDKVDTASLSAKLGCPVIETSAKNGTGLDTLANTTVSIACKKRNITKIHTYSTTVETSLNEISSLLPGKFSNNKRFISIKLFERDNIITSSIDKKILDKIDRIIKNTEIKFNDDSESIIISERYNLIEKIIKDCTKKNRTSSSRTSEKIDSILTNKFLAIPIFFLIIWLIYYISIQTIGNTTIKWMEFLFNDIIGKNLKIFLQNINTAPWLISLVIDGLIGGVGAVLTFLPQLMILFLLLSILEDCGYMARIAFIMDRIFGKVGLSGKSFIPMVVGAGCSVPGIMATRTIESENERRMTIMLTPFIPCGAKLPVFALFVAALFPNHSWIGPSMYLVGILMVMISGFILKRTSLFKNNNSPFIMELPDYKLPKPKNILLHTWEHSKAFIIKAGTIIFIASGILWFLQNFNSSFEMVEEKNSILMSIGNILAPIGKPMGFGNAISMVAMLTGFLAKETIVATFGILLNAGTDEALAANISTIFTPISAYSFMIFTLLASPCFAAIGAIKREMGSIKWTLIAIAYQMFLAYITATLVYQIGHIIFVP